MTCLFNLNITLRKDTDSVFSIHHHNIHVIFSKSIFIKVIKYEGVEVPLEEFLKRTPWVKDFKVTSRPWHMMASFTSLAQLV